MLEGMLGEEVFRTGVSSYLKRFEFNNAETDDLWAELYTATQNTVDVKKVEIDFLLSITVHNINIILYFLICTYLNKLGNGYMDSSSRVSSSISNTKWN